jgi:hypothetical protein
VDEDCRSLSCKQGWKYYHAFKLPESGVHVNAFRVFQAKFLALRAFLETLVFARAISVKDAINVGAEFLRPGIMLVGLSYLVEGNPMEC